MFPGRDPKKPLSNMAFLMALRRMGRADITAHGFRSSFRDWAAERTNFPREVCERALAHVLENKVEAAYRRSDLSMACSWSAMQSCRLCRAFFAKAARWSSMAAAILGLSSSLDASTWTAPSLIWSAS